MHETRCDQKTWIENSWNPHLRELPFLIEMWSPKPVSPPSLIPQPFSLVLPPEYPLVSPLDIFSFPAFLPTALTYSLPSVPSGRHHQLARSHPMAAQGSLFPGWSANSNNRKKKKLAIRLWGGLQWIIWSFETRKFLSIQSINRYKFKILLSSEVQNWH